ncbi:MAG: lipo-like protein [Hyphomicrobiales bacterium]|uniref:YiiX/YebB-like N1pC/P60 family cysteine hydrolase n=1 Tax=Rhabdaerophilum calidifontis TaxID=2604328 RepID=UPI00123BE029|nr:YiiX/YebB-like N1pC/P60 family cysteine hydrolase [Rhabdaerophilum calidifontis]MCA1951874.1 lipo-like protein [Hyphomicrobiales bacterium]MCA1998670.1 lipo-like protein [Hyphomicrobiales bacterium]
MNFVGRYIARILERPIKGYEPATTPDFDVLRAVLRPADVILVEGSIRVSSVIKYLTQSTWSHSAIYVGDVLGKREPDGEPHVLIEAEMSDGVITSPLSKYRNQHIRICRPIALERDDQRRVVEFLKARIGHSYDIKNVLDLLRFLVPLPIPARLRRRMLALGSGDPTRAICSTLIAEAFNSVRYPILPRVENIADRKKVKSRYARREILHIRHHSLYAPRDFDISPYFAVVKPTIEAGFDYKALRWTGSFAVSPAKAIREPAPGWNASAVPEFATAMRATD